MGLLVGIIVGYCLLLIGPGHILSTCMMNEPLTLVFVFSALLCFQHELLNSEGMCEKEESASEIENDHQDEMMEMSTSVPWISQGDPISNKECNSLHSAGNKIQSIRGSASLQR